MLCWSIDGAHRFLYTARPKCFQSWCLGQALRVECKRHVPHGGRQSPPNFTLPHQHRTLPEAEDCPQRRHRFVDSEKLCVDLRGYERRRSWGGQLRLAGRKQNGCGVIA